MNKTILKLLIALCLLLFVGGCGKKQAELNKMENETDVKNNIKSEREFKENGEDMVEYTFKNGMKMIAPKGEEETEKPVIDGEE